MYEHTGGVLGDLVVVFHRDVCREHRRIGRRNYLMADAANTLSAATDPELSNTKNPIANLASDSATAGLPGCLSRENAGRTMPVLHHVFVRECYLPHPGLHNI